MRRLPSDTLYWLGWRCKKENNPDNALPARLLAKNTAVSLKSGQGNDTAHNQLLRRCSNDGDRLRSKINFKIECKQRCASVFWRERKQKFGRVYAFPMHTERSVFAVQLLEAISVSAGCTPASLSAIGVLQANVLDGCQQCACIWLELTVIENFEKRKLPQRFWVDFQRERSRTVQRVAEV